MGEHDRLFKRAFRTPEGAAALLRAVLPPPVLATIDLDTVELVDAAPVDARLTERFVDALVRVRFRGPQPAVGYVRVLLEHLSGVDNTIPLHVAEYMVRAWLEDIRRPAAPPVSPKASPAASEEEPLAPTLVVILYHGERRWSGPRRFHDLFPGLPPALQRFVPSFDLIIDDLTLLSDDALAGRGLPPFQRLALWSLRDGRSLAELLAHLGRWAPDLAGLASTSRDDATTILRYILTAAGDESFAQVCQHLLSLAPSTESAMQSAADELIQEGIRRGEARGMALGEARGEARGKAEAVVAVLTARGFTLTDDQRQRILTCVDAPTLERWVTTAVTCSGVEALFSH